MRHLNLLITVIAGVLFGAGLVISDMANPARVLAFLTISSQWDATLAFVMGGALSITVPGFYYWKRRHPEAFSNMPSAITKPLIVGSVLFGTGWGLGGFCPGPAIAATALLRTDAMIFLTFMLMGAFIARTLSRK